MEVGGWGFCFHIIAWMCCTSNMPSRCITRQGRASGDRHLTNNVSRASLKFSPSITLHEDKLSCGIRLGIIQVTISLLDFPVACVVVQTSSMPLFFYSQQRRTLEHFDCILHPPPTMTVLLTGAPAINFSDIRPARSALF